MSDKQQLKFALAALVAGVAWGYMRHRGSSRAIVHSMLQGLEWFVAYGGAAALIGGIREKLEDGESDSGERIMHLHQVVAERTGTDG